ncbi:hypothetical protein JXO52_04255 [bacterium]|nr:hypothetical protein [bacterium]
MKNYVLTFLCLMYLPLLGQDIPRQINYQGVLTDTQENPVNGQRNLTFRLYTQQTGGSAGWSETHTAVAVTDGFFCVLLGSQSPIPAELFDNEYIYLETVVSGTALSPRQRLTSVAYAYAAAMLGGETNRIPSDGNILLGATTQPVPEAKVHIESRGSGLWQRGVRLLNPALETGCNLLYSVGRSDDMKNAGQFYFHYTDNGSDLNRISLGLYGVDNVLNITAAGRVGIGTVSPQAGLQVRGVIQENDLIQRWGAGGNQNGNTTLELFKTADVSGNWLFRMYHAGSSGSGKIGFGKYMSTPWSGAQLVLDTETGNVGIGTDSPDSRLTVNGTIRSASGGFQFPDGSVQTSAASGGTGGFSLPYSGSTNTYHAAFRVINTNTLPWLHGEDRCAGRFETTEGSGLIAIGGSIGVKGIASNENGSGLYGSSNATGGYGVKGISTNGGYGVYGKVSGGTPTAPHYAGYFDAEGDIMAHGLFAKSGSANSFAAIFHGTVAINSWDGSRQLIALGEGLDYAEGFNVADDTSNEPGTVLSIDPKERGKLTRSTEAYDTRVAGIVAGAEGLGSGVRLGAGGYDVDVALAGRVYCNVTTAEAAIECGDLLTTSSLPGYAMKAADPERSRGAILGKAMEPLEQGKTGRILVLVTLQ